jgi:hypothetical protein
VDDDLRFTFTVPDGWAAAPLGSDIWLASEHNSGPAGGGFLIGRGGWVYSEPCGTAEDPDTPIGTTVDEFVDALVAHPLLDTTDPIAITIGGYPGTYLEIQGPADRTDCQYFQAWGPTFYAQGDSNHQPIWVVDVAGVRVVIHGSEFPDTAPQRSAELRAIVESMRIERDPTLLPSPSPRVADTARVVHGWPGSRAEANPAGLYSWAPNDVAVNWMHSGLVEVSIEELGADAAPSVVDAVPEIGSEVGGPCEERVESPAYLRCQAWIVHAGGTSLVVKLGSYADASPAKVAEAVDIVRSIEVEPMDTDAGYRLVFELPADWDSG